MSCLTEGASERSYTSTVAVLASPSVLAGVGIAQLQGQLAVFLPQRLLVGIALLELLLGDVERIVANLLLHQSWAHSGMVTIKFESELARFKGKLESSLVRFLAHDCLDGPRQRRAF